MALYIVSEGATSGFDEDGGVETGTRRVQMIEADSPADAVFAAVAMGFSSPSVSGGPVTDRNDPRISELTSVSEAHLIILEGINEERRLERLEVERNTAQQDSSAIPDFRNDPTYNASNEAFGPGFVYGGGDNFGQGNQGNLPDLFYEGSGYRPQGEGQPYAGLDILRGLGLGGLIPEEGETIRLLPGTGQELGELNSLFRVPTANTLRDTPPAGFDFLRGAASRIGLQPEQLIHKIKSVTPDAPSRGSVLA